MTETTGGIRRLSPEVNNGITSRTISLEWSVDTSTLQLTLTNTTLCQLSHSSLSSINSVNMAETRTMFLSDIILEISWPSTSSLQTAMVLCPLTDQQKIRFNKLWATLLLHVCSLNFVFSFSQTSISLLILRLAAASVDSVLNKLSSLLTTNNFRLYTRWTYYLDLGFRLSLVNNRPNATQTPFA